MASGGEAAPARPRLLLVEDDPCTHSAFRKIFARLGWEVSSAMTVAGGLMLLELRPEALILDLMLPDGDGVDLLRKIRADRLATRVAVMTGVEDRDRLDAVRLLRPEALVRKPVDLDEVLRAIGARRR